MRWNDAVMVAGFSPTIQSSGSFRMVGLLVHSFVKMMLLRAALIGMKAS